MDAATELERLRQYAADLERLAVCPACGMSLLSDHDLDCPYWGKPAPEPTAT
jgi:predicted amidophosphoribosyltransferase